MNVSCADTHNSYCTPCHCFIYSRALLHLWNKFHLGEGGWLKKLVTLSGRYYCLHTKLLRQKLILVVIFRCAISYAVTVDLFGDAI